MEPCAALPSAPFLLCHPFSARPISSIIPPMVHCHQTCLLSQFAITQPTCINTNILTSAMSRGRNRQSCYRSLQAALSSLHIFFWVSDVENRTGWSLSMYLVPAARWEVTANMKNESGMNLENTELLKRQWGKLSPTPLWFFWSW